MKEENAIEVKNIVKKFRVYIDKGHTLKEKALFRKRRFYEERIVLNGISFSVKKGEAVGLIGHNGCGKSTLLKLMTKIMYPDSGTIEMCGRVSSLIELGAGFHPDMSGRENIYINASIFGLSKKEIDERIDDMIAFSELEQFIDHPVRTYSSGMYMRLAFSVAINVNADILLIDEILAVGDAGFQAKCFNRLKEIKAKGTTIVIVSHSMGQIEEICDRSIWINQSEIAVQGKARDVNMQYLEFVGEQQQKHTEKKVGLKKEKEASEVANEEKGDAGQQQKAKHFGNGKARIEAVYLLKSDQQECLSFITGDRFIVKMEYKVYERIKEAVIGIGIYRIDEIRCYGTNTKIDQLEQFDLNTDGSVLFEIPTLTLLPGKYVLDVAIENTTGTLVDYCKEVCSFEIYSPISDVGIARMEHKWQLVN